MKKTIMLASILTIVAATFFGLFFLNEKGTVNSSNVNCVKEGKKSYGEAPVVYQCCSGLKMVSAIDDSGEMTYDVAYCTKCGDDKCKKPENKYNCPDDCK